MPILHLTPFDSGLHAEHGTDGFSERACLLAVCGWQPHFITKPPSSSANTAGSSSGEQQVQDGNGLPDGTCEMQQAALACSMCGARVGLWAFHNQPGQGSPFLFLFLPAAVVFEDLAGSHRERAWRGP